MPFYTQLETAPCPFLLDQYINWWRALRVYVYDDPGAIAHAYDSDTNPQNATPISPPGTIPSCPACALPLVVYRSQTGGDGHGVSLPPVDPSQLLEFTFALVLEAPQPLSINYAFVDYDISSVDQVYLPVAMDPINNPYIGYIGSVLARGSVQPPQGFAGRLAQFQSDFGWPKYKWPDYVTNQGNLRLPGTFNVMNEIANPGSPPPFVPDGPALKQLPVIQAMETLWNTCCGAGWPGSPATCTPPSPSTPTCDKMAQVAHLFEQNYARYQQLCATPTGLSRDHMLANIYGWVPFISCPEGDVDNQLQNTPGYGEDGYAAVANAYVDLQYHSPPTPTTYGDFNRYVQLIHDVKYLRVGEYAFSIDDAAGNMLEVGEGLNIAIGGPTGLGNPNPYDPWRYFLFVVGDAPESLSWTKYRICTQSDPATCPSTSPDRNFEVSGTNAGLISYAGIKIGAVPCPCVIVLQDSGGTIYRVAVKNLPAPPPTHPINQQGDPPTALDSSWAAKAGNAFANVACADTTTPFAWCTSVIPTIDPGAFPPRTGRVLRQHGSSGDAGAGNPVHRRRIGGHRVGGRRERDGDMATGHHPAGGWRRHVSADVVGSGRLPPAGGSLQRPRVHPAAGDLCGHGHRMQGAVRLDRPASGGGEPPEPVGGRRRFGCAPAPSRGGDPGERRASAGGWRAFRRDPQRHRHRRRSGRHRPGTGSRAGHDLRGLHVPGLPRPGRAGSHGDDPQRTQRDRRRWRSGPRRATRARR